MLNRAYKKQDEEMLRKLKEKEEVNLEDIVKIPGFNNHNLIENHSSSIIINFDALKTPGVVLALPGIWEMEGRVRGRGVGDNKVQFIFDRKDDLQKVLAEAPWHVNGWLVTGEKWSPQPAPDFLTTIPIWMRIKGIPLHLSTNQVVDSIAGSLGRVEAIKLHAKKSESMEYLR
ncbi:unnamed protein product [Microthlaspi erraticum]|uniref:DUF4283 domain-containing protein n=1 Tax=Microthlaspi erraticum TaxID=1685480 RepID=A0A6D2KIB4_9BRAS|nr:unnamed protein product [Microthlaspi erraticum]